MISKAELRQWQYYILIGTISFITVFFLPFIGSNVGLKLVLPNTVAGWMVYVASKLLVAVVNILLFHCFMQQAKINVKDHPKYIEANQILNRYGYTYTAEPRGPIEWQLLQYKRKGTWLGVGTLISAIGLSQAILSFSWISMLTYLLIIIFGVIFGILQMNNAEEYWTEEYYEYAKSIQKRMEMGED